jgi:cytidyltransferase-like protein
MILCHRGISYYYPENTLGSIIEAIKCPKYGGVEIDIQFTKDNKWIVYHDDNLIRLNSKNINVKDTNYDDLGDIEWKGTHFPVTLFSELSDLNIFDNFCLNIEIKPLFNETNHTAKNELKHILKEFKFNKFLSSFDHDWFDWCMENTTINLACLTENIMPSKGTFWILDYKLLEKIDLFDIMKKNITLGTYGKKIDNVDEPYNLKYQIVDDKEKKVVYVDGTFDLLHPGHIDFFKRAKALGNYLIAGVLDDSCVESYKRTPIISLKERTTMLENLRLVDKVISPAPFYNSKFGNLTKEFLQKNEIDYVVYAGELGSWSCHYQAAIEMNIMTIFDYGKDNISTSEIIKRIQDR